jgi:hypothetical protein
MYDSRVHTCIYDTPEERNTSGLSISRPTRHESVASMSRTKAVMSVPDFRYKDLWINVDMISAAFWNCLSQHYMVLMREKRFATALDKHYHLIREYVIRLPHLERADVFVRKERGHPDTGLMSTSDVR